MNEQTTTPLTLQYRAAAAYQAQVAKRKRERLELLQRQHNAMVAWMVDTMRERLDVLVAPDNVSIKDVPHRDLKLVSVDVDGLTFFAEGHLNDRWGRNGYGHNPHLHVIFPCPRCGQPATGYAGTLEQLGETLTVGTLHYRDGGRLCEASNPDSDVTERDGAAWGDVYDGLEHAEVAS